MKIRYRMKEIIKNLILFRVKSRYKQYCNAVQKESDSLPDGIGVGYCEFDLFLYDDSLLLTKINNW